MPRRLLLLIGWMTADSAVAQQQPPLIDKPTAAMISSEASGTAAKRTVQSLSVHHRMRGSQGYKMAAELIRDRLLNYGLEEVEIIALPADGKTYYGTQRARPAWNASFAELWEQRRDGNAWADAGRVASWNDQPITLAQDSIGGSANADLVDVGTGTAEADYAGKDVRGKLVLISAQPEAAAGLAVHKYGAAGIVSWAQNQKQGWWGEDESLIRWGHLDTWKDPAFAFMVSPARAHQWQERLRRGEQVRLRARVEAGRSPGSYLIPTAVIPGRDRSREIVFSCHLDHPSPGANDNASGCAGELEIARLLNRLIAEGKLPKPERTIRFIWPCEVECTIALLNGRPEFASRTLATIHLDMIGGDTEKVKSILRVQGSPPSLPSFVDDVAFSIAKWVNAETLAYADTGVANWPFLDPEGSKRPLQAEVGGFSEGSDHTVWAEGSWRIPVIYLADWPDRYIHTQRDIPENLDPTKLKRAIFIGASAGWYLANLGQGNVPALDRAMHAERLDRHAAEVRKMAAMAPADAVLVERHSRNIDIAEAQSLSRFGLQPANSAAMAGETISSAEPAEGSAALIYRRKVDPKGPMSGFGYSWLDDQLEMNGLKRPALLDREGPRDTASFAYEALNLVDGTRNVRDIRDFLSATIAPVPVEDVAEFLATLENVGLLEKRAGSIR
jgi:aminopeptidase YwaD